MTRHLRWGLLVLLLAGCQQARPPVSPPPGMVLVGGGPCLLGGDPEAFFGPTLQKVQVADFYIDITEVTRRQYREFRPEHVIPPGQEDCPVTHISKEEAQAYLASQGKRLPRAAEWEKAARGTDGRRYPWGSDWDFRKGNLTAKGRTGAFCSVGRMKPVGSYPQGISPYGCLDMCGNAWEWVEDLKDGRPVIRGGAYGYRERDCRSSNYATEDSGFT